MTSIVGGTSSAENNETNDTLNAAVIDVADDLEDGEIDDDDDDENDQNKLTTTQSNDDDVQFVGIEKASSSANTSSVPATAADDDIVFVGLVSNSQPETSNKSKKPRPVEDDHAVNIENAIANALKKKGIEPPMPKMLSHAHNADADAVPTTSGMAAELSGNAGETQQQQHQQQQQSRNSRRRKRKKDREREQKKDKEQQKRARRESPDEAMGSDEMDEYEMMNVRGGSPPPAAGATATAAAAAAQPARFQSDWADGYDSPADNYSSYDSYSEDEALGLPLNAAQRRRMRRDKDARSAGAGAGGGGGGGNNRKRRDNDNRRHDNKRNRQQQQSDSGGGGAGAVGNEEKVREPRKLELCKFYLMDCCAKRDKCSYMHKEFPCKYYYLGMDCFAGDACLFHHGEPLNEQLRNILLKHMETAPKEILGDFKRIPREHALSQMSRRHDELCEKFSLENTWAASNNAGISRRQEQQQQQQLIQQQLVQQLQQQQQALQQSGLAATTIIPSLLDMVINPPPNLAADGSKPEKKRKSRWAEKTNAASAGKQAGSPTPMSASASASTASVTTTTTPAPLATASAATKALPAHLDLVNLTNVLSADHIAKLKQLGINNLEQMLQIPFGQLTEVGLTLLEIGEIQRKAAAIGGNPSDAAPTAKPDNSNSVAAAEPDATIVAAISSNSNSNSNGVVTVDYTQYLKDANFPFDRNDLPDDDDEQLVIDDSNDLDEKEQDEEAAADQSESGNQQELTQSDKIASAQPPEDDDVPLPSVFDLPTFMSKMLSSNGNAVPPPAATATTAAASIADALAGCMAQGAPAKQATAAVPPDASKLFSQLIFGNSDAEARAAFYRDIIRNPFKAHSGDADNDNSNSAAELLYGQHDSRSLTPTPTGASSTPEPGSQSPKTMDDGAATTEPKPSLYTRRTRYDFDPISSQQQEARAAQRKADRDLRSQLASGLDRDIDMRLPFEPITHYTPATEVDAAIFSHKPIIWELNEVEVDSASYVELRLAAAYKEQRDIRDPRMRRIIGLPELPDRMASEERERKTSNCISSPESGHMSPLARDTTPLSPPPAQLGAVAVSMAVPPPNLGVASETAAPRATRTDPRRDPRRAHMNSGAGGSNNFASRTVAAGTASNVGGSRQIGEIRNLLQTSSWYNNLGSNNKIMVNQQLALVFTELKKYHQQEQPHKIFDVNFIVNNRTLQQIFAQLHVYIDDNGLVVQLLDDGPQAGAGGAANAAVTVNAGPNMPLLLPNMSQPPPNLVQLLRQPPPNICNPLGGAGLISLPPFSQPPPSNRPSLLGMPPVGNVMMGVGIGNNPFNPFGAGIGNGGPIGFNAPQQLNGGGGCGPIGNFKNFGGPGNNQGGGNRHFGGGGGGGNRNHRGGNNRNRNI